MITSAIDMPASPFEALPTCSSILMVLGISTTLVGPGRTRGRADPPETLDVRGNNTYLPIKTLIEKPIPAPTQSQTLSRNVCGTGQKDDDDDDTLIITMEQRTGYTYYTPAGAR